MVKTTLHEARAAAGLSIRTVAEAAGVSESSYGNYEHGFYYPRPDARERLCALFGAAEADLWPEGSRRSRPRPRRGTPRRNPCAARRTSGRATACAPTAGPARSSGPGHTSSPSPSTAPARGSATPITPFCKKS